MSSLKAKAFIGLGSNIGDRAGHLKTATKELEKRLEDATCQRSPIYLSKAWGVTNQNDFYNQVIAFETGLEPESLLHHCIQVEKAMGRNRARRWHSRNIDIDLLFVGNNIRQSEKLNLPHPMIEKRNFVLVPLMELAPQFIHPILGKTIEELYLQTNDLLEVLMLEMHG
ncbi:MAG: 2-amino-4-hydroxy-6-hydroxymethyldihydropteridine diphosphokinase [Saprospiraceae bacterium]|nr:2-amino-4-hydroxy-6-hydroxymethyldihydropteridine diphosphokinase [Saprospiraceae bacterium]